MRKFLYLFTMLIVGCSAVAQTDLEKEFKDCIKLSRSSAPYGVFSYVLIIPLGMHKILYIARAYVRQIERRVFLLYSLRGKESWKKSCADDGCYP